MGRHFTRAAALAVLGLFLVGCAVSDGHLLGREIDRNALMPVHDARLAKATVTVRGGMIAKCPVAACWFRLRDRTGVLKVDVKAAGFTVAEIPNGAQVTVSGKIDRSGGEPVLSATGLRW